MRVPLVELRAALGTNGVLEGSEVAERAVGWSRLGLPAAILRPANTAEVSTAVRLCAGAGVPVVPWGGKTGLVDGACVDEGVALSLDRMNRVEVIDPVDATMTVQAGCIVQKACDSAEAEGLFFPLDLGARGSATIGGVIATNAGGNRVVRFGMMRDLVLGVEAVLADGTVVSSLHPFMKNNTGYDLKQLFIGSEGTLGVVTRAVLRLRQKLVSQNVALVATRTFPEVLNLLRRLEARLGGQLSAFEVMWSEFYELVTIPPAPGRAILPHGAGYYVLVEALGGAAEADSASFEGALAEMLEAGIVCDAVIAQSRSECNAIWALRDDASQVQRLRPFISFDVSLRLSTIETFVAELRATVAKQWPQASLVLFGHVGDGNIHVVVGRIDSSMETQRSIAATVYETLTAAGGSISAEHGIGLEKRPYLSLSRSVEELALMRRIKRALDPQNILNPGKIFEADGESR
jgi:FAD/FMN-containing dehydrogenase